MGARLSVLLSREMRRAGVPAFGRGYGSNEGKEFNWRTAYQPEAQASGFCVMFIRDPLAYVSGWYLVTP